MRQPVDRVRPHPDGGDPERLTRAFGDPDPPGCDADLSQGCTWSLPGGGSYRISVEDDLFVRVEIPSESPVRMAMEGELVLGSAKANDLRRAWGTPTFEAAEYRSSVYRYHRANGAFEVAITFRTDADDRLESATVAPAYYDTFFIEGGAMQGQVVEPVCDGDMCRVKQGTGADLFWWTNHCLDQTCTLQATVFATRAEAECDGCQAGLILLQQVGDPEDDRYRVHYTEYAWIAAGTRLEFTDEPAWYRSDRPDCPFLIEADELTITNPFLWADPEC